MYSQPAKTMPAEITVYTDDDELTGSDAMSLLIALMRLESRQIIARLKLIERLLEVAQKQE